MEVKLLNRIADVVIIGENIQTNKGLHRENFDLECGRITGNAQKGRLGLSQKL
jgi:hypothetical protein